MTTRKQEFIDEYTNHIGNISWLVIAMQSLNKIKIISNKYNIGKEFVYYTENFDNDLYLKTDKNINIIDWMIV